MTPKQAIAAAAVVTALLGVLGVGLSDERSRNAALRVEYEERLAKTDAAVTAFSQRIDDLSSRMTELEGNMQRYSVMVRSIYQPQHPHRRTPIRDLFSKDRKKGTQR